MIFAFLLGSRFIHLIRTYSNVFLFMAWVIFHCIYVPELLYLFIEINTLPNVKWMCVLSRFSCTQLLVTPWTVACQAPLLTGFSRQDIGIGCHNLLQGIFLTQGSKPGLLQLLHCRWILNCWATSEACKMDSQWNLLCDAGSSNPVCCDHLEVWDQVEGGRRLKS